MRERPLPRHCASQKVRSSGIASRSERVLHSAVDEGHHRVLQKVRPSVEHQGTSREPWREKLASAYHLKGFEGVFEHPRMSARSISRIVRCLRHVAVGEHHAARAAGECYLRRFSMEADWVPERQTPHDTHCGGRFLAADLSLSVCRSSAK